MRLKVNFYSRNGLFFLKNWYAWIFWYSDMCWFEKKKVEINNCGALNKENGDAKNFLKLISLVPRSLGTQE